jgi:hypothetical protein
VIGFVAFRPTPDDTAGLSVYREIHVSASRVAASGRKQGEYYVARLSVKAIRALGLTVVSDEQAEGLAGHALIPELSVEECKRDKPRARNYQVRLAELAEQGIVVVPVA